MEKGCQGVFVHMNIFLLFLLEKRIFFILLSSRKLATYIRKRENFELS